MQPEAASHDDWLDCIGYVVESGAGRLGRVEGVEHDDESGRPVALLVRAGLAGRHVLHVPVDEVVGVLPGSARVVLDGTSPVIDAPRTLVRD